MFYLYSIWRVFYRRRHRRSVRFIKNLPIKNAPAPPWGTRTENTFLRYHLVCRKIRPLCNGANTPSALNAGMTSVDTGGVNPFPSALGGPFAAPLFAPLSAAGTLCGCAAQFYFRFLGLDIVTLFNYSFVRLSRTFFRRWWKRLRKMLLRVKITVSSLGIERKIWIWIME